MQVTHELMNEHQLILKYIELMERYINFSQANEEDNLLFEKAQDFVDFIKVFADSYHHVKEEDMLFKYLQTPGVLSHCNPLPVMLSDHEQGRMFVQNMTEAMSSENKNNFCTNASNYGQLMQQHIMKEDNILYPMAEEGLSDDNKIALDNEYKQIEEQIDKQHIWKKFQEKHLELESCLNSKVTLTE